MAKRQGHVGQVKTTTGGCCPQLQTRLTLLVCHAPDKGGQAVFLSHCQTVLPL